MGLVKNKNPNVVPNRKDNKIPPLDLMNLKSIKKFKLIKQTWDISIK